MNPDAPRWVASWHDGVSKVMHTTCVVSAQLCFLKPPIVSGEAPMSEQDAQKTGEMLSRASRSCSLNGVEFVDVTVQSLHHDNFFLAIGLRASFEIEADWVRGFCVCVMQKIQPLIDRQGWICSVTSVAIKHDKLLSQSGTLAIAKDTSEPITLVTHLSVALKKARTDRSMTIDRLSKESGVARRTLIRMEAGDEGIAIGTFLKVARALSIYFDPISFE